MTLPFTKCLCWFGALSMFTTSLLAAEPSVTIQYRDKPPYSFTKDAQPAGFLLRYTMEIFQTAGIPVIVEEVPVKRITHGMKTSKTSICSPGWYKLPDRELYARYSLPLYEDKPHLVLARTDVADQIKSLNSIKKVFNDSTLQLGTVEGTSYGYELDAMIANTKNPLIDAMATPMGVAQMIGLRRADYMLIDEEDYNYFKKQQNLQTTQLVPIQLADMPKRLSRYIMCNKHVSPDIINRLNKVIAKTPLVRVKDDN